jgi:AmmeMemoRadiSam system protein A
LPMDLTTEDKKELLRIARESIHAAVNGTPGPKLGTLNAALTRLSGAFVTLHIGDELRGCVGYVEPRYPLGKTVYDVAVKAAFEDPRFFPLSSAELEMVDIEISVLSPLEKVKEISEIEVGIHGLVVEAGYRRGLLLPQVATEYKWGRTEFLNHTAIKAGLPPDAWQQPEVSIFRFSVDRFSELELLEA